MLGGGGGGGGGLVRVVGFRGVCFVAVAVSEPPNPPAVVAGPCRHPPMCQHERKRGGWWGASHQQQQVGWNLVIHNLP